MRARQSERTAKPLAGAAKMSFMQILYMHRAVPPCPHDLRQSFGIIAVSFVELHAQRRSSMARVKADHVETSQAELMNEPRRRRTSLNADTRLRAGMLQYCLRNMLRRGNALTSPLSMSFSIDNAERCGLL